MTHPGPDASFISYHPAGRHEPEDRGVIHCCSENSIYDPFNGAQVLSGSAPDPPRPSSSSTMMPLGHRPRWALRAGPCSIASSIVSAIA